jgi:hypothetical protein
MEFSDWIKDKNIKNTLRIQENIFEWTVDDEKYILKRIDGLSEYLIQKELNQLKLPVFQKKNLLLYSNEPIEDILNFETKDPEAIKERERERGKQREQESYGYTNKDKFYILMKKINGTPLKFILDQLSSEELETIIQIIFWSLKICWDKLEFVHLDLHLKNILIQKLEEPVTIILDTEDKLLEIETLYIPFIIDFEDSITGRYPNESILTKKTVLHDLWTFLGILTLFVKDSKKYQVVLNYLSYFIDPLTFQEKKEFYARQGFRILP